MSGDPLADIRDALNAIAASMVTREDLNAIAASMATREELRATREELRATREELTSTRVAIMARIDRLQDAATLQHDERIVDIGSAERSERLAKAARDDVTAIGEIVTPLIRLVHGIRAQLDDLAEQVRVLKEGRHAA